jgi:serine/threonine protein kinase/formylglycine-generating enzyme required for sulfatase activity
MRECSTCHSCFADDVLHCPYDGVATMQTLVGDAILDSRYQLEKRLGQGGMGVVFKARHIFLKTQHAIKIILPDLVGNDPNLVTRFRQEALAAAAIRHQNIIAVTDFGVVRGTMPFLVMEFVQGRSLQELMAEEGAMPAARAFEIMQPICSGIAAAHRQKIVHRDLKPLNVMIQDDLAIAEGTKILDFGLAKIKSGELLGSFIAAQTTGLMGSPFYMAPEQWSDEPPDARADIYSLGVMLYQMLCGEVPFKGSSIPAIMKKHVTADVPTLASKGAEVPPQIEAVVRHALEKEPAYRTASADDFIGELGAAMEAASATLKRTGDPAPIDPGKTITSVTGMQSIPPVTDSKASFDPMAGTVSGTSLVEEQEKFRLAQERAAREAEARRQQEEQEKLRLAQEQAVREAEAKRQQEEQEKVRLAQEQAAREAEAKRHQEEQEKVRLAQEQAAREAEAKRQQEEQEKVRLVQEQSAREAEARRLLAEQERQQREAAERAAERLRQEEIAKQQKAEEKIAQTATPVYSDTTPVVAPEATPAHPPGVATVFETSFPEGSQSFAHVDPNIAAQKRSALPLVLIVLAILLIGGGSVGGYLFYKSKTQPQPAGPTKPNQPEVAFKPDLIEIPGGAFQMGRSDADVQEGPAHKVSVNAFAMDKTEVTSGEYAQFVRETNHPAPQQWGDVKPPAGRESLPVSNVSYEDALAFAAWRSRRDHVTYRLPTEEEWEYAARNGDKDNLYPWGDTWEAGRAATQDAGLSKEEPVGTYPQGNNRWGVEDLMGNVWEWTSSKASLYPGNNRTLPDTQDGWIVVRGGGYQSPPSKVSGTRRDWFAQTYKNPQIGFRLVRSGS